MKEIQKIREHGFVKELYGDAELYLKNKKFEISDIELENPDFDEFEYFIHAVGFSYNYFFKWCQQLEFSVEFLSNYNYGKNQSYNRADHLVYNVENYIIRYQSILDRLLQLINSTFHLCISEVEVTHAVVMSNYKVSRTNIPQTFKPIKKLFRNLYEDRNTLIHRHSYLEKELRRIEIFYTVDLDLSESELKRYRARKISEYITSKKKEYQGNNDKLFKLIPALFDELLKVYVKERNKLKLICQR